MSTEWKREMAQPKPQGLVAVVLPLPHGELRIEPASEQWVIWPRLAQPSGSNKIGLWCEGDLDIVMREAPAAVKAALDLLSADLADYIATQNQEAAAMRVIFVKNANQTGSDMIDMLQEVGKDKRRHVSATIHIDFFWPNTSRIYKALERGDAVECEMTEIA